jgi:hypothetical protein
MTKNFLAYLVSFLIILIPLFSFPQAAPQNFEKRILQNNLRILLPIKITIPIFEILTFLKNRLPLLYNMIVVAPLSAKQVC